jgi:hypothetical protein
MPVHDPDQPDRTSPHRPVAGRNRPPWRDVVRRGMALGLALALHLALLARILSLAPAPWSETARQADEPARDDALQLTFLRRPAMASAAQAITPPRLPPQRRVAATHPQPAPPLPATPVPPDQPPHISLPPVPDGADAAYHPGSFRDAIEEARHPRPAFRLPGSAAVSRVPGIRLRAPPPSLKQVVRMIGQSQACYAMRTDLTHGMARFLTPGQVDRRLEAEGCGPQASKEDDDPGLNAAAERFISGH